MQLIFPGIPPALKAELLKEMATSGPFRDEEDEVEVFPQESCLIFKHKQGYSFCKRPHGHENDVETFRAYLKDRVHRRYMPITYEIGEDPSLPEKVIGQFREKFSGATVDKIQWMVHREHSGGEKLFLILQIPEELVFALFHENGGQIVSTFKGKAGALRKIQMLAPLIPETTAEDEVVRRVFGTQYGAGGYQKALAFHWQTVQELAAKPNMGISFGPVGIWVP
jgi:hypothetical protein